MIIRSVSESDIDSAIDLVLNAMRELDEDGNYPELAYVVEDLEDVLTLLGWGLDL